MDFVHDDFYAQALAKLERGLTQDLADVRAMHEHELIEPRKLRELFEVIREDLIRFPRIDPGAFQQKVRTFVESLDG